MCVLQREHSGDGCDLASTLRKSDLFVLSWAMVRQMSWGSISSELLMCGEGVRSIFFLLLVAICLETICIWHMLVFILQTTQPTSGGAVTSVTNGCANCVIPSRPQQLGQFTGCTFQICHHSTSRIEGLKREQ